MKVPTVKTIIKGASFPGSQYAKAGIHMADEGHNFNIQTTKGIQKSVSDGFEGLGNIADTAHGIYADMEKKKQLARDETDALDYMNGMRKATGEYLNGMSQNPDYNTWTSGYNKAMNDYHSTFVMDKKPSDRSMTAIQKSASHYKVSNDINISHSSMKADNAYNIGRLEEVQSDAIKGSTLSTVDESFKAWEVSYDAMGKYIKRPPEVVKADKAQAKSQTAYIAWNRAIAESQVELTAWEDDTDLNDKDKLALSNSLKRWKYDGAQAKKEETQYLNASITTEVLSTGGITDEYIDAIPEHREDMILKARKMQAAFMKIETADQIKDNKKHDQFIEDQTYLLLRDGDVNDPAVNSKIYDLQSNVKSVDALRATDAMVTKAKKTIAAMSPTQVADRTAEFKTFLNALVGTGKKKATLAVYDAPLIENFYMGMFDKDPSVDVKKQMQLYSNVQKRFDEWALQNPKWTRVDAQKFMEPIYNEYQKDQYMSEILSPSNETEFTVRGRKAVFNSKTKEFLRWK